MKRYLIVPAALWLAGCGEAPKQSKESAPAAAPVAVSEAAAAISAKWMGYVREVKVQTGDRVKEGQLLVTLDSRDLDSTLARARAGGDEARSAIPEADSGVAAAKANLDLAQSTFGRMQDLFRKKSISNQE